eukprot:TRINITY_DN6970_c0_g1_i1.p1 TRINITY_DN6970_c0_g1~~TRINITY_DN6970_c0_g1_i1.p1  ORF type:complete len:1492 (-),score=361.04 TRINITY_DN6970_c0_g1_i1:468-4556(-)
MVLFGAVREINAIEATISLPNSLTGTIALADFLPRTDADSDDPADDQIDEQEPDEDADAPPAKRARLTGRPAADLPNLPALLSVGQLLHVAVRDLQEAPGGKRKRIHLSAQPEFINAGLTKLSLHKDMLISGRIQSVEDHGYIVDLGLADAKGFLSHSNALSRSASNLLVGTPLECVVLSVDEGTSVVSLSADPTLLRAAMTTKVGDVQFASLRPGTLVSCKVKAVFPAGLLLSFLEFFHGTADISHIPLSSGSLATSFPVGKKLKARILWIDAPERRVGLSLRPNLIALSPWQPPLKQNGEQELPIGTIVDKAEVVRIDSGIGALLSVPITDGKTCPAYVHISRASDEAVTALERIFKVGSTVTCRVVSINYLEGVVNVATSKSILVQQMLRFDDIKPGQIVKGTITRLEDFGLIVSLADRILGLCPRIHSADVPLTHLSKKFKVNSVLQFRVVECNPVDRGLILTCKPSLLNPSALIPVTSAELVPGALVVGWVSSLKKYGCIVSFFNRTFGLVPISELAQGHSAEAQAGAVQKDELYGHRIGQIAKCRVVSALGEKRVVLSFNLTSDEPTCAPVSSEALISAVEALQVGVLHRVVVLHADNSAIHVRVESLGPTTPGVHSLIPLSHLSDHPAHCEPLSKLQRYAPGSVHSALLLNRKVAPNRSKATLVLSLKPSLIATAAGETKAILPASFDVLQVGALLQGFISSATTSACFVQFLDHLTGFCPIKHCSDSFVADLPALYPVGMSVRGVVLDLDKQNQKFTISLKPSISSLPDVSLLQSFFVERSLLAALPAAHAAPQAGKRKKAGADSADAEKTKTEVAPTPSPFAVGDLVTATVEEIMDYGVVSAVPAKPDALAAFTITEQCKDVECAPGDTVPARVLDIDRGAKIVDLSFRPEFTKAEPAKKKKGGDVAVGATVEGVVEVVKASYAILSFRTPAGALSFGFVPMLSFNLRPAQPNVKSLALGTRVQATVALIVEDATQGVEKRILLTAKLAPSTGKTSKSRLDPALTSPADFRSGLVTKAKVTNLHPLYTNVQLNFFHRGRLHVSEIVDANSGLTEPPSSLLSKGQIVDVVLLGPAPRSDASEPKEDSDQDHDSTAPPKTEWFVSIRPSVLEAARALQPLPPMLTLNSLSKGQVLVGYVQKVSKDALWVTVAPSVLGRVFLLDASDDLAVLSDLPAAFKAGQQVKCHVLSVDPASPSLDLSLRFDSAQAPLPAAGSKVTAGDIVVGKVAKVMPSIAVTVQIGAHSHARVVLVDLLDKYTTEPWKRFQVGQLRKVCVLAVDPLTGHCDASLRESRTHPQKNPIGPTKSRDSVVRSSEDRRCFERLCAQHDSKGLFRLSWSLSDSTRKNLEFKRCFH